MRLWKVDPMRQMIVCNQTFRRRREDREIMKGREMKGGERESE